MFTVTDKKQQQNAFASVPKYAGSMQSADRSLDSRDLLQRSLGNGYLQAISETDTQRRNGQQHLQTKLVVGSSDDVYEQEADHVAEKVMRISEPTVLKEQEEETLQAKELTGHVPEVNSDLEARIQAHQGSGQPLTSATCAFFEPRFGVDFSSVRIHADAAADQLNRALNSRAFTVQQDIFFRQSEYDPLSLHGKQLLAHELTHVIHQSDAPKQDNLLQEIAKPPVPRYAIQRDREDTRKRELWHPTGEGEWAQLFNFSRRSIEGWRDFLKNADEKSRAIELNVFLALATGHTDYIYTPPSQVYKTVWSPEPSPSYPAISEEILAKPEEKQITLQEARRKALAQVKPPSDNECRDLMVALLSTPDIDLVEIGALSPALGYLLSRFIDKYYQLAIRYIALMVRQEGPEKWTIKGTNINEFLLQADRSVFGGAFSKTKSLTLSESPLTPLAESPTNRLPGIGVGSTELGPSPTDELLAKALLGAQAASVRALVEACDADAGGTKINKGTIQDRASREITEHAKVLSGISLYQDKLRIKEQLIMDIVGKVLTAGLGGYANIQVTSDLAKSMLAAAGELTKNGVSLMAKQLNGLSRDECRTQFKEVFHNALQETINRLSKEATKEKQAKGEKVPDDYVPDDVREVANGLTTYFAYSI